MKSGMISIVGRPNVGKSTLINNILGKKIAITSDKSGTTRNIILGVYNDDDSQIVLIDTPGIHKPTYKLDKVLNDKSYLMTNPASVILFMVDISKGFGKGDRFVLNKIEESNNNIILILNKIDKIDKDKLIKEIDLISKEYNFKEIIPISSLKGININELIKTIKNYLPDEGKYYEDDYLTNQPESLIITERVREKVLHLTKDEVPHTVTCICDSLYQDEKLIKASVTIVVDRDNLKKILIGKNGSMLKKIGTKARIDLEDFFNKKVYLSLYVKVIKNWRDKDNLIADLGLKDDLDE